MFAFNTLVASTLQTRLCSDLEEVLPDLPERGREKGEGEAEGEDLPAGHEPDGMTRSASAKKTETYAKIEQQAQGTGTHLPKIQGFLRCAIYV